MADVDQSVMWRKWMGELQAQIFPNGLGADTQFSAGSTATPIDLNDTNPAVTNYGVYSIGDVIPANSPNYAPAPSGLVTSYALFLDWIDLGGTTNPNMDSQINLATANFNAAQSAFATVQGQAFTQYGIYKTNATGAGITVPPFTTWVIGNYPAYASAKGNLAGTQSTLDQLSIQRYGPGYQTLQNARALVGYSLGGAQDITTANVNNMPIVSGPLPPPGSTKVQIGDAPIPANPSAQISSFAPNYALDASYLTSTYPQWQAASVAGTTKLTIDVSSNSQDYDYKASGWSAAYQVSYKAFFWSASSQGSASSQTVAVDTSSSAFKMSVSFTGFAQVPINPGPWWQNGSLVTNYKNKLKPGAPDFFSDKGSLARRAFQVVLGFEPSVTITMAAADYSRLKTAWTAQASVSVGVGPFSFGASASANGQKDKIQYDDAKSSITIGPIKSTMPVLLGVLSQKLS